MDKYEKIEEIYAKKYNSDTTTRKAIGDFMLSENYAVDVKSNNIDKNNYSPNICSAYKLYKWIQNSNNKLSYIFVDYREDLLGKITIIEDSGLVPVEHISWDCLTIQAQGNGVVQKCKDLKIDENQTREQFINGLRKAYKVFVDKERIKLKKNEQLIVNNEHI